MRLPWTVRKIRITSPTLLHFSHGRSQWCLPSRRWVSDWMLAEKILLNKIVYHYRKQGSQLSFPLLSLSLSKKWSLRWLKPKSPAPSCTSLLPLLWEDSPRFQLVPTLLTACWPRPSNALSWARPSLSALAESAPPPLLPRSLLPLPRQSLLRVLRTVCSHRDDLPRCPISRGLFIVFSSTVHKRQQAAFADKPVSFSSNSKHFDYEAFYKHELDKKHKDKSYRYFNNINRLAQKFPRAHTARVEDEVTVWCANDYLGMGRSPVLTETMK